jgi:hypothetical protein
MVDLFLRGQLPPLLILVSLLAAGVIDEIVPQAEPGARTFLVKVRLPDMPGLYSGMFGRLTVPAGTQTLLRLTGFSRPRPGKR